MTHPDDRCPSCDHRWALHGAAGCWYTVTEGSVGRDLVCPCTLTVTRPPLDRALPGTSP